MRLDDLSQRAEVNPEDVKRWVGLGLIEAIDGEVNETAVERARLLRYATARGIEAGDIAAATAREGDILGRFVDHIGGPRASAGTVGEVAAKAGLDPTFVQRLWAAGSLSPDEVFAEDLEAMRSVRTALDAGLPESAILQLVRVFADALGRVADAESRLFHFYVHERLRAEGRDPAEIAATVTATSEAVIGLVEPTILYFHRKAWARALRDDLLVHFAEDVSPSGAVGELPVAVLFVDLVSFTPMTEAMGDEAAAHVLDRFSEFVRAEALGCDGRVVKQIGDEFMLVFPNARGAVSFALHLAEAAGREAQFPALRMGAHFGTTLYREADYLGATVNLAARLAAQAVPGELVVTGAVCGAAKDVGVRWRALGPRALKGVAEPVELFAAQLSEGPSRPRDLVCGMELDHTQVAFRVQNVGEEPALFCSSVCRDVYLANPARFTG